MRLGRGCRQEGAQTMIAAAASEERTLVTAMSFLLHLQVMKKREFDRQLMEPLLRSFGPSVLISSGGYF